MGEMIGFCEALKKQGKLRCYGASNFTRVRLDEAAVYTASCGIRGFSMVQNEFTLAVKTPALPNGDTMTETDKDLFAWHTQTDTPLFAYSASANGLFAKAAYDPAVLNAGRYNTPENRRLYALLADISKRTGADTGALALAYLINQPFPCLPICARSTPAGVRETMNAANIKLSEEDIAALSEIKFDLH